jgi:hypothetical protein
VDLRLSTETVNTTATNTNNNNNTNVNIRSSIHINKKEVGHAENKHVKNLSQTSADDMQIDGEHDRHVNNSNNNHYYNAEEEKIKQEKLKRDEEAKNYFKNLKLLRQSVKK